LRILAWFFDAHMNTPNQIHVKREDVHITAQDLLAVPEGDITEEGLRVNLDVGLQYLESWLRGLGCVPIYNLMEDAATAEISRAQVWQWVKHQAKLSDGRPITRELFHRTLEEELAKLKERLGEKYSASKFDLAAKLFSQMIDNPEFPQFLTLPAYEYID
jgi:malate synthase